MVNETIIKSGYFYSTGVPKDIDFGTEVDWITVNNADTAAAVATPGRGVEFFWQRGMADDSAINVIKLDGLNTLKMTASTADGFIPLNSDEHAYGALTATITDVSNDAVPLVSLAAAHSLHDGDIVRLINVQLGQQLGGYDFTVDVTGAASFELAYMAQIVATDGGSFLPIKYDSAFYPRHRYISKVTKAIQAEVTMTVTNGFTVGQRVRFVVPQIFGMRELDGLSATILAVNTVIGTNNNEILLDLDTSSFTAFAFPLTADVPFSPAMVIPIGEDSGELAILPKVSLGGATENRNITGMRLNPGILSPAGAAGELIYWEAGKSDTVTNE